MDGTEWFCVVAKPGHVAWARINLEAQIADDVLAEVYAPEFTTAAGRRHFLFINYVLVRLELELHRWSRIRSTRGVSGLLPLFREPTPIPANVVADVRNWLNDNSESIGDEVMHGCVPGDTVRVLSGPFLDFEGLVLGVKKGVVVVELTLFGVKTRTQIACHRVRKVDARRVALAA